MMLIRCPNCDSTHEVPASLMSDKPRKLRCAVCRTVFEATANDADSRADKNAASEPFSGGGAGMAKAVAPGVANSMLSNSIDDPLIGSEEDMAAAMAEGAADTTMSVDDIDSLFDDPLPPAPKADEPESDPFAEMLATEIVENPTPDALTNGLDAGQGAAIAAGMAAAGAAGVASAAATSSGPEPVIRKRNVHGKSRKEGNPSRLRNAIGLVAATGIGTLVALAIFRHETVRLMPSMAPAFEMFGLEVNSTGLEIHGVRSHILREDSRDTLEVTGQIVNITRVRQPIPILRLSLHSTDGQQLYVWTATADHTELGPGEKALFRRRLASPPKEAEQVMVRFVARDDIVAAIR
ncbi:MAG: zinc-ribbon domain-containing protein [Rhabdaerophilum sp.]